MLTKVNNHIIKTKQQTLRVYKHYLTYRKVIHIGKVYRTIKNKYRKSEIISLCIYNCNVEFR